MADPHTNSNVYKLEVENELRVVCGDRNGISLQVTEGSAEVFGTEMEVFKQYILKPFSSASVFSWQGCSIRVNGQPQSCDIVQENNMILNTYFHACLEEKRVVAESDSDPGPVVMVVGPINAGKSTLCTYLLNYAARMGRKPLYIDIDVGQNTLSIPGCISVCSVNGPADIIDGFTRQEIQVYHYGHNNPGSNFLLYMLLIKRLGQKLKKAMWTISRPKRASGVVINTTGWTRGPGYNALTYAALEFEIDVVAVLEDKKLYENLKRDLPSSVEIIMQPKGKGVVERDPSMRAKSRDLRIYDYFFGSSKMQTPFTFNINLRQVEIYEVVSAKTMVETNCSNMDPKDLTVKEVPKNRQLVNVILAISMAKDSKEEIMSLLNVMGFICVSSIDENQGLMTILSPNPPPLPNTLLLKSGVYFRNKNLPFY